MYSEGDRRQRIRGVITELSLDMHKGKNLYREDVNRLLYEEARKKLGFDFHPPWRDVWEDGRDLGCESLRNCSAGHAGAPAAQNTVKGREVTLRAGSLSIETIEPGWRIRFLEIITNPNIGMILMLIGIYGIICEFANPGFIGPGLMRSSSIIAGLRPTRNMKEDTARRSPATTPGRVTTKKRPENEQEREVCS